MPDPAIRARAAERLLELYERHRPLGAEGAAARYYRSGRGYRSSQEAGEERDRFGVCVVTTDGAIFEAGDHSIYPSPLQSISKVFVYALALADNGRDDVLERVGVEPSGDAFNSLVFDEHNNRPYNPMVNAGALIATDMVRGEHPDGKLARILDVLRGYAGNHGPLGRRKCSRRRCGRPTATARPPT